MTRTATLLLLVLQGCASQPAPSTELGPRRDGAADTARADHALTGERGSVEGGVDLELTPSPILAPASGTYAYGTALTITAANPKAMIYYTLDGTPPTTASKLYRGALKLSRRIAPSLTAAVRAIAVVPGRGASAAAAADYTMEAGMVIHFKKPSSWGSAFVHYWATTPTNQQTTWPGQAMTPEGGDWYYLVLKGQTSANLVFNGNSSPQTADLLLARQEAWYQNGEWWDVDPEVLTAYAFPGGRWKALVISMDDGNTQDRTLVAMLNSYKLRGTFHLNSGRLDTATYVTSAEVKALYAGHEVSGHTVDHPYLSKLSAADQKKELADDQAGLQKLVGTSIRGLSYPFGDYNQAVLDLLPTLGFVYARVVPSTGELWLPGSRLEWRGTCHQVNAASGAQKLLQWTEEQMALLFIWGHSWQFDKNEPSWSAFEAVCKQLSGHPEIWYATAVEVADYLDALRLLTPSLDRDELTNGSTLSVWRKTTAGLVEIKPGQTVPL